MEKFPVYKRTKINWWMVILLGGCIIYMIFGYIYQWGSKPIDKTGFVIISSIFSILLILLIVLGGRFKVIIDDESAVFRSDVWIPVRIPIIQIESVSAAKVGYFENTYIFDFFAKYSICILLKTGKKYLICIKDAERIKEEIEKRMLKSNDK